MEEKLVGVGSPITKYIQSAINQIKAAETKDAVVGGLINIEMSTVLEQTKGKTLDIKVIRLGEKVSEQNVHKISVPFRIVTPYYRKHMKALEAEADARLTVARNVEA